MISSSRCATATSARFLPRLPTSRPYSCRRCDPTALLAAQAHCTSTTRSHLFPFVVLPLLRLPALSLLPGHTPTHDARCAALGNWLMSDPTSTITFSAA